MKILPIIVLSIILVTLGSSQFIQGASNNPTNSILKISFDKSEYSSGDKVKIILEYPEFNNPQKLDIFGQTSTETVNIQTNRGTLNHIQFTETGINTGIFTKEITLGGPKGFISYSNTGTSLPNGETDMLIVTVQDQMNSRSASKMVPINPIQSRVNSSQILSENSENSNDVDCTPLSIDVPNRIIENLSVYVKNPNVDNCEYVFSLHDTEFLKIKTLGNVFFSKTLLIDRNMVNGDYYILVMSTDNQYSKFFPVTIDLPPFIDIPLDVEIPDNIENIFSNLIFIIIIISVVILIILIVIIVILKSRNKTSVKFSDEEIIRFKVNSNLHNEIPDNRFPVETEIIYNFDNRESIIKIDYSQGIITNLKQFIKNKKIFDDDKLTNRLKRYEIEYIESSIVKKIIHKNSIKFSIGIASNSKISSMRSGGNYEFRDDFDKGYNLIINQKETDVELMKQVTKFLQNKGWGCLYGERTTHCHMKEEYPKIGEAIKLLEEITREINQELKNNGLRISIKKE